MSHIPQRKEKNCLNCGHTVAGRYCQHCGQENVEPKETFWHMVTHFFYDITHFDSSFFHTVHHLLFKPGFLSKEYMNGRRVSYLHPIRMYVFTSAIFFLLFFSIFSPDTTIKNNGNLPISPEKRMAAITRVKNQLKKDTGNAELKEKLAWLKDTARVISNMDLVNRDIEPALIELGKFNYHSREEYDSLQRRLPAKERDNWLERRFIRKAIDINERVRENPDEALKKFTESLLHRLPYMLFVSLPLFALLLKLVYVRRRQFFYADHGVFTIHLYVFTFLLLMAVFALNKLSDMTGWGVWTTGIIILFLLLFFYLYKAMRNFYGQRRAKTIFKFMLVTILSLFMMLILFVFFLFFSAATF